MIKFYHSSNWNFDNLFIEKKKKAKSFLESIRLSCCIRCVCNHNEVKKFFAEVEKKTGSFLVIVIDSETLKRIAFFNIVNFSQLQALVEPRFSNDFRIDRLRYCVISQMQPCQECFTATIISDGRGNAIIEFIKDTVDNRFLTSGGNYELIPQQIFFNEYKMVYCNDINVLLKLWPSLKVCLFFKGYYECSYAIVNDKKQICFSFYSDDNVYQNNLDLECFDSNTLKSRCNFLSIIENGFIN